MNQKAFDYITGLVIDKLEGGYFHPDMRTNNPSKFGSYHRSGETMFGLDRHAGHSLFYSTPRKSSDVIKNMDYIYSGAYKYKSPEAKKFWEIVDKANARKNWSWNTRGGNKEKELRDLVGKIMFPQYEFLAKTYLTPESREIIESDPRLLFNFIYAVWNGSGWFKKFANDFNKSVKSGVTNKDKLVEQVISSRTKEGLTTGSSPNSLIKQGGEKISKFINNIKLPKTVGKLNKSKNSIVTSLMIALGLVSAYVLATKYIKK
jgi:hypothetical protein